VNDNSGVGISATSAIIEGNVVQGNGDRGIYADYSTITGNEVRDNHTYGIYASYAKVLDNTVLFNGGVGLQVGTGVTGYARNLFNGNNSSGTQVSTSPAPTSLGPNICGSVPCP
jgi:parallel beta-helix repeat protein